MKTALLILLTLFGCAQTTNYGGCSVKDSPEGAVIFCKDGTKQVVFDGLNGTNGIDGVDGADGTQFSTVPLCPGVTVYPTTFIEIAFCIEGELYATYSANNGFSTLLPPGTYSSNAIGSTCSFTVATNCVVTH